MNPELKHSFASRVPLNRVPWFDVLVSSGALDEWLNSSNAENFHYALNIIEQPEILRRRGDEVAKRISALLEKKDLPAEQKQRMLRMFAFDWFHGNEALFSIFLSALKRGEFETSTQEWGMRFYNLPERYPHRAVQVLEAIFDLAVQRSSDGKKLDFSRYHLPEDFVGQVITRVPKHFAKEFLPRLVDLMRKNEQFTEHHGLSDTVWPVLMYGMNHDLKWTLLDRLAESLETVATKDPEALDKLTAGLEDSKLRNVAYLLLTGWSGNPQRYADRIVEYLLQHPDFLGLGYSSWGEGNGQAAIARAAISAASKHCSEENLRKLELAILNYYPAIEKEEPRRFGYFQALLLHAIDPTRISLEATTRKEQLDRKFPKLDVRPPEQSGGAFVSVQSPIPPEAVPKMTDENWLAAMRQYHAGTAEDPGRWMLGGVYELARQLEIATRLDKLRFAKLALKMDDTLASSYFDSIVRGLVTLTDEQKNNSPLPALDSPALFAAFIHIANLPSRHAGQWLVSSIAAVADRDLPKEILDIVVFHALHGRTPEKDGAPKGESHGANLVNNGINTIRGSAAESLAKLLFKKPERWLDLKEAVMGVITDKSWSVQAVGVLCLSALLNIDRNLAVSLFVENMCKNDALLGSMFVSRFLMFATQTHYPILREILLRMLVSQDGDARETAAQAIALASFRVNAAVDDLQFVTKASEDARAAWAEVAENNLRFNEVSQRCREWLKELFFDPSTKVRDVASRCFHKLSSDQLCAEVDLIDTFLKSPAFEHAANFLLIALEGAVDRLPDIVCRIPERALELFRARKEEAHRAWWTHQMSTLVLRLYNQTRDPEIRRRCLDGIDTMIELGVGEVGVELEKIGRT